MKRLRYTLRCATRRPSGVTLMIAVLVLAALSSLLATLSIRVTMAKRRQAYMVEYQRARYALDSAMKYALSVMPMKTFALSTRAEVPDFSDLFWMSGDQYAAYLAAWTAEATDEQLEKVLKEGKSLTEMPPLSPAEMLSRLASIFGAMTDDPNAPETATAQAAGEPYPDASQTVVEIDPNDIEVPGPYGPAWPYVLKPIELEIGTAKVTITIEDENAKMPLVWAITNRQAVNKQAEAVLATFCDWMGMDKAEQEVLAVQLGEIYTKKMFELNPSPVLLPRTQAAARPPAPVTRSTGRAVTSRPTTAQQQAQAQAAQPAAPERPAVAHATDFAKLFHSALLDREPLARPAGHTALPDESPLKYLALWGSQRVNVNTAPRQVLEAALTFGGDPVELVEKIIQRRKEAPFKTIDEMKEAFYSDSLMIDRAKDYLTTTSNFFLIRVVSHSGNARVSATATVIKEGRTVERLAILYGL